MIAFALLPWRSDRLTSVDVDAGRPLVSFMKPVSRDLWLGAASAVDADRIFAEYVTLDRHVYLARGELLVVYAERATLAAWTPDTIAADARRCDLDVVFVRFDRAGWERFERDRQEANCPPLPFDRRRFLVETSARCGLERGHDGACAPANEEDATSLDGQRLPFVGRRALEPATPPRSPRGPLPR